MGVIYFTPILPLNINLKGIYMPLYEYKCECGKVFDYIQSINDDKLKKCPTEINCNSNHKVTRLIGKPMIQMNEPGSMPDRKLYKELDIDK